MALEKMAQMVIALITQKMKIVIIIVTLIQMPSNDNNNDDFRISTNRQDKKVL